MKLDELTEAEWSSLQKLAKERLQSGESRPDVECFLMREIEKLRRLSRYIDARYLAQLGDA
jgi:hypothetical protein